MTNDLVPIELAIREGDAFIQKSEKYHEKANDMLLSAGLRYLDAQRLCQEQGLPWLATLQQFTKHSPRHVQRCMAIAKGPDPESAVKEYRAQRNAQDRENYKVRKANTTRTCRTVDAEQMRSERTVAQDTECNRLPDGVGCGKGSEGPPEPPSAVIAAWIQQYRSWPSHIRRQARTLIDLVDDEALDGLAAVEERLAEARP